MHKHGDFRGFKQQSEFLWDFTNKHGGLMGFKQQTWWFFMAFHQ